MSYLVWTTSTKGPMPEKWTELLKEVTGRVKTHLEYQQINPEHEKLSLEELAKLYPMTRAHGRAKLWDEK